VEVDVRARALLTIMTVLAGLALWASDARAQGLGANGGAAYGTPEATADTRTATGVPATPAPPAVPAPAPGQVGAASPTPPAPVAGATATLLPDGRAAPPVGAPPAVQQAVLAANALIGKPYKWGGGHRKFIDRGYDCSGAVSFALNGGSLLDSPLDSRGFFRWGEAGEGQWITVWTKSSHAFVVIAGLRLDTSAAGDPSGAKGPRWRPVLRSTRGFRARHPENL
jgi:cell wall-associated NlpC family hydrolase